MRISTKQSRKSANAATITNLHINIKRNKATAATLFKLAQETLRDAKVMSADIEVLARQQKTLKRELKSGKMSRPARAKKADTRPADHPSLIKAAKPTIIDMVVAAVHGDVLPLPEARAKLQQLAQQRFAPVPPKSEQLDNIGEADSISG